PGAPPHPGGPGDLPPPPPPREPRGLIPGCLVFVGMACTCQMCCGTYEGPWSRRRRDGMCKSCGDCCECCSCCSDGCQCCECCGCCDC
ncbi:hypothetical protein GTY79_13865, partial [Streptomyces sp. SID8385]|nr:hypothetical protein [Streptomyces sp. SID8385]